MGREAGGVLAGVGLVALLHVLVLGNLFVVGMFLAGIAPQGLGQAAKLLMLGPAFLFGAVQLVYVAPLVVSLLGRGRRPVAAGIAAAGAATIGANLAWLAVLQFGSFPA